MTARASLELRQADLLEHTHSVRKRRLYVAPVASSAMRKYIARAASQLRVQAGRKRYHVSAAAGEGVDPSTLHRFESGRNVQDADQLIDLYAADLDIEPIEFWTLALEMWHADQATSSGEDPALSEADRIVEEAETEPVPGADEDQPGEAPGQSGEEGPAI